MKGFAALMQHVRPRIDFNEIEHVELDQSRRFRICLIPGVELSHEALIDCKKQIELQAKANVPAYIESDDDAQTLVALIDAPVKFDAKFLDYILRVFAETDTAAIYSDYDINCSGITQSVKLPAWSPIRFESIDYLGPVIVFDASKLSQKVEEEISREIVVQKCLNNSERISRLPRTLYTCEGWQGKHRTSSISDVQLDSISIVIPTRGIADETSSLLERCVNSLRRQDVHSNVEVIVVVDKGYCAEVLQKSQYALPPSWTMKTIEYADSFNFSKKCNLGASNSSGEILIFLNDDVELISQNAITTLALSAKRNDVGAVGSILKFQDGSIQHAGVTLQDVKPRNSYVDQFHHETIAGDLEVMHEVSAVTGACLAISRLNFEASGGWDEELHNSYNDVDLCLRLNRLGLQTIVTNDLEILHHESVSRDSNFDEVAFAKLKSIWPQELGNEQYLRSPEALGIGYQGTWGIQKELRVDLSGKYFQYFFHLLRVRGPVHAIVAILRRISGKTTNLLQFKSKSYL